MAQRVNILVESDLSGDADASTVEFGLDGTAYEIDLTDKEQAKLRDALAKYVGAGRKVTGKRSKRASSQTGPSARVIREWAKDNGYDVPDRGRIPADVREAFDSAN